MSQWKLVVGNRNYSSWSLRGWLVLQHSGLPFSCIDLQLQSADFAAEVARYTPVGKVPVLLVGEMAIWDSLAIAEFVAEQRPDIWPADPLARARARSLCAEMHAGFGALRQQMPMNLQARDRQVPQRPELAADIARIEAIWSQTRQQFGAVGPWLFGHWSIADAFFAPVAARFRSYGVALGAEAARYQQTLLADPAIEQWLADGVDQGIITAAEVGQR